VTPVLYKLIPPAARDAAVPSGEPSRSARTAGRAAPNYQAAVSDSFYDQMVIGLDRMMSVGAVMSTPVIDGDTLFFGSWDGQLYAIS
jgi:PQQ-like domain